MFTPQIVKFENKLASLQTQLDEMKAMLHGVVGKLDALTGVMKHNAEWQKKSWLQFEACSKGFQQVREACECLREELSSAAGTMVDRSWEEAMGVCNGC